MRSVTRHHVVPVRASCSSPSLDGGAQQRAADPNDPRVGLKAGLHDAGEAARNMKRVASLPKPDGFFDPAKPGGDAIPPERDPNLPPLPPPDPNAAPHAGAGRAVEHARLRELGSRVQRATTCSWAASTASRPTTSSGRTSRSCSRRPCAPAARATSRCTATCCSCRSSRRAGRLDCGTQGVQAPVSAERFRGVRIFDITDLSKPKQVAAVQTCRGSHTHTLVTDPERQGEPLRLRLGHERRAAGRGARRLLGRRIPTRIPTRRSSAST